MIGRRRRGGGNQICWKDFRLLVSSGGKEHKVVCCSVDSSGEALKRLEWHGSNFKSTISRDIVWVSNTSLQSFTSVKPIIRCRQALVRESVMRTVASSKAFRALNG